MYHELECDECGFSPTEQESGEQFESEHWKVERESQYSAAKDKLVFWEEIRCPYCKELVLSTL